MIERLALRNLLRRPVQSAISIAALALGLALTVFMVNFQVGMWDVIVNTSVRSASGHVVAQAPGFQADDDLLVADSAAIAAALREVAPERVVLRRVTLAGLIQSPVNNIGVRISGVEPEAEAEVNAVADKLVDGEWLRPDDTMHAVIGASLARKLDVGIGDKVVLVVGVDGELESRPVRVRGIFESGSSSLDGFFVYTTLPNAQAMLPAVPDPASQVSLVLDGRRAHVELLEPARAALAHWPVEVLSWEEALPDLAKSRELDIGFAYIMWPVLALVVSIGVLNTLLMSLFERTRELGVMLALGMRPRQLFRLLLTEGFLLGLVGSTLGLLGGLALSYPAATSGFELPGAESTAPISNVAFDGVFYATISPGMDIAWALFFVLLSTLVSAYPALKAASTDPTTSLRKP